MNFSGIEQIVDQPISAVAREVAAHKHEHHLLAFRQYHFLKRLQRKGARQSDELRVDGACLIVIRVIRVVRVKNNPARPSRAGARADLQAHTHAHAHASTHSKTQSDF
jgi:hypothetical protein